METLQPNKPEILKITFSNSFLEYLVALIAVKPLGYLLGIVFLIIADSLGYKGNDMDSTIMDFGIIISFIILISLATKVVKHKLRKKEEEKRYDQNHNN